MPLFLRPIWEYGKNIESKIEKSSFFGKNIALLIFGLLLYETPACILYRHCMAELSPVCAVVGGVLAQEVIKVSESVPSLLQSSALPVYHSASSGHSILTQSKIRPGVEQFLYTTFIFYVRKL